jgi:hypothetical protein
MRPELRPEIAAGLLGEKQKDGKALEILTLRPEAIEEHLLPGATLHRLRHWELPGPDLWLISNQAAPPQGP